MWGEDDDDDEGGEQERMEVKQDGESVEVKVQRRREEKPLGSQLAEPELRAKTAWGQHLRSSLHPIIRAGIGRISAASSRPRPDHSASALVRPGLTSWRESPCGVWHNGALSLSPSPICSNLLSGPERLPQAARFAAWLQQFPGMDQPPPWGGGGALSSLLEPV